MDSENLLEAETAQVPAVVDDQKNNVELIPITDVSRVIELINNRKQVLAKILEPDDIQKIGEREFKKKKYWRKLGGVYGVSLTKLEERFDGAEGKITYYFTYRASTPNGVYADGTGACTQNEKNKQRTLHDTRGTAETRAKNRAIADLLAFGEVSAEEIETEGEEKHPAATPAPTPTKKQMVKTDIDKAVSAGHITVLDIKCAIWSIDKANFNELTDEEAVDIRNKLVKISKVDLSTKKDLETTKGIIENDLKLLGAFKPTIKSAYDNGDINVKRGIVEYITKENYMEEK